MRSLIFLFAMYIAIFAYTGPVHKKLTKESQKSLRISGYTYLSDTFLNLTFQSKKYIDIISDASSTPDFVRGRPEYKGLEDYEINDYSDYINDHDGNLYNFDDLVITVTADMLRLLYQIDAAETVEEEYTIARVRRWLTQDWEFYLFNWKYWEFEHIMEQEDFDEEINKLRSSTQHTYVNCIEYSLDEKHNFNFEPDKIALQISVCPWAAQAEYNLALKAWGNGKIEEALKRLGRSLHYVQDITVPHHCEISGNYPDLIIGIINGYHGETIRIPTQLRYEGHFLNAEGEFSNNGYVWDDTYYSFEEDNITELNIKDLIILLQTFVRGGGGNPRFIEWCDGVPSYWYYNSSTSPDMWHPWDNLARYTIYPKYMGYLFTIEECLELAGDDQELIDVLIEINSVNPDLLRLVGKDDDFETVSSILIPLAVTFSASIIVKFFREVGVIGPLTIKQNFQNSYIINNENLKTLKNKNLKCYKQFLGILENIGKDIKNK